MLLQTAGDQQYSGRILPINTTTSSTINLLEQDHEINQWERNHQSNTTRLIKEDVIK